MIQLKLFTMHIIKTGKKFTKMLTIAMLKNGTKCDILIFFSICLHFSKFSIMSIHCFVNGKNKILKIERIPENFLDST